MRSDKPIRLDQPVPVRRTRGDSDEIARQTQEFLARGGRIQELPSNVGARPLHTFNASPVVDRLTGRVATSPSRKLVDGRMVLRMPAIVNLSGWSSTVIYRLCRLGEFPAPVIKQKPKAWDEHEVLEWIRKHGKKKT